MYSYLTRRFVFNRAEFRRSRLQPGEHDGRVGAAAARNRAVHRALSHSVAARRAQSGDVQVQVRFHSGVDRALLAMLVSVYEHLAGFVFIVNLLCLNVFVLIFLNI